MRSSVISSVIAVVVAPVVDRLAIAGVAVRTVLHHMYMREHLGQWRDQREDRQPGGNPASNPWLSLKRLSKSRALALCPAYAASARSAFRG